MEPTEIPNALQRLTAIRAQVEKGQTPSEFDNPAFDGWANSWLRIVKDMGRHRDALSSEELRFLLWLGRSLMIVLDAYTAHLYRRRRREYIMLPIKLARLLASFVVSLSIVVSARAVLVLAENAAIVNLNIEAAFGRFTPVFYWGVAVSMFLIGISIWNF